MPKDLGFSALVFTVVCRFFIMFSVWFSVFVKNTSNFLVLVSDVSGFWVFLFVLFGLWFLFNPVTWYGINYAGHAGTQEFQNKGKSGWTGTS